MLNQAASMNLHASIADCLKIFMKADTVEKHDIADRDRCLHPPDGKCSGVITNASSTRSHESRDENASARILPSEFFGVFIDFSAIPSRTVLDSQTSRSFPSECLTTQARRTLENIDGDKHDCRQSSLTARLRDVRARCRSHASGGCSTTKRCHAGRESDSAAGSGNDTVSPAQLCAPQRHAKIHVC